MARQLETIQKHENLNRVYSTDEKGPGGAYHKYEIVSNKDDRILLELKFQKGPRNVKGSIEGIIDTDLLEIVRDRLQAFQDGEFKSVYNEIALKAVEEALQSLNKRVEDRIKRDVLGKNEK